jgi:hypothetical protein
MTKNKTKCPKCTAINSTTQKPCKLSTCRSTLCWIHGKYQGVNLFDGTNFKYRIKKSQIPNAGYGLFLSEKSEPLDPQKNKYLYMYSGDYIPRAEYIKMEKQDPLGISAYGFCNTLGECVDARSDFNLPGKYANDAYKSQYKNSVQFTNKRLQTINVKGKELAGTPLVILNKINPGDEIFIDYDDDYWKFREIHNKINKNKK